jgi:phthalate 4,5-cis-dihydrodiol dehydrogenase
MRAAIAGLGVASTQVLPAMERLDEVDIVAAADMRPEARTAFEERYGARTYETVEALCDDPDVEVVWISTPNQFHAEHVVAAANRGKNVIVEKPMALSIEEADRMVDAVDRNGVQLLCGHTQSLYANIQEMRRVIRTGELGRLQAINIWAYTDWMLRSRMPQEVDLSQGGGIVYRQGPHQVDTVRLLGGGMLRSVRAMASAWMEARPCPGYYAAYLEFEDGTPATIVHNGYGYFQTPELVPWDDPSLHISYSDAERLEARRALKRGELTGESKAQRRFGGPLAQIHGSDNDKPWIPADLGIVLVSCERGDMRQSPHGIFVYDDLGSREVALDAGTEGMARRAELMEMYHAIRGGPPVFHNGRWGMGTLEVILAIMQSAKERREIMLTHQTPLGDG